MATASPSMMLKYAVITLLFKGYMEAANCELQFEFDMMVNGETISIQRLWNLGKNEF